MYYTKFRHNRKGKEELPCQKKNKISTDSISKSQSWSALNTEEITKILTHCKLHDIFVMIDETYVEFAPDIDTISAVSLTTKFDNFMILRGTSKFFCAPGLRLDMESVEILLSLNV